MIRRAMMVSAALALTPGLVAAQRKSAVVHSTREIAATCGLNKKARWIDRQTSWFFETGKTWKDDALRKDLMQAAGITALALPPQPGYEFVAQPTPGTSDDPMVKRLLALAAERGSTWPTKSIVGATGVHAVFILAQRDTSLLRAALKRMMESGPEEAPAADVAVMDDRLRIATGRKQIFGTQFMMNGKGESVLAPMEDKAHANMRREDATLPPIEVGVCVARMAAGRTQP
jgi:hypothetical protein